MDTYMGDLSGYFGLSRTSGVVPGTDVKINESGDNSGLELNDFLTLMVAQFQNQSIDSNVDTADMLNQMVQMSVIQAISEVTKKIDTMTDASVMSYASSLVGKEVTIGNYTSDGKLEEFTATVTGTGVIDGEQVVFVGDETYYLANIMAVGRLPETKANEGAE